jgi:tripartite-type tricarboxylate transporter receptor subunit TctC
MGGTFPTTLGALSGVKSAPLKVLVCWALLLHLRSPRTKNNAVRSRGSSADLLSRSMFQKHRCTRRRRLSTRCHKANGYTLLMATTGIMAINEHLYKNMSYRPARDLMPVSYTSLISNILVVAPSVPANNVAELIALAKKSPGTLSFASSGAGSSTHLSGELFKYMSGTSIFHVPYRGNAPALTDVMAGQVTMVFDNAPSSIPFIKDGKLKALGVTGKQRLPGLPQVPTIDEAGVSGYESLSWSGIVAPANTPAPIVLKLNQAIDRILKMEDVRQRLAGLGVEPVGGAPEVFARHIKAESDKWGKLIKAANIVVE